LEFSEWHLKKSRLSPQYEFPLLACSSVSAASLPALSHVEVSNRLRVFVVSDPLLAENFTVRPANSGEEMTVWVVISLARHGLTAIFIKFYIVF